MALVIPWIGKIHIIYQLQLRQLDINRNEPIFHRTTEADILTLLTILAECFSLCWHFETSLTASPCFALDLSVVFVAKIPAEEQYLSSGGRCSSHVSGY